MRTNTQWNAATHHLQLLLERLERERVGLTGEVFGPGNEERGGWDAPRRPDEQGGVRMEDEITLGLLENEDRLIAQITAAMRRLNAGTYGRCENCGGPISIRRLQAIPYASLCIACARSAEPTGRG